MRLVIGGVGQGKLAYAQKRYAADADQVADTFEAAKHAAIWNHLEGFIRTCCQQGQEPLPLIEEVLQVNPDIVILCDEVGCGVVPVHLEERKWREAVGRTCCVLAETATSVERIFCGIPMKLKG